MVSVLQVLKDFQERTRVIKKKLAPNKKKKKLQGNKRTIKDGKGLVRTEKD